MDYKDYSRREILDKAEYYRSIGKKAHQKKLEDYVKAMDYGTDGFGVPYKKCSDSELKKLMDADPEPEKLPTAAKSDKKGAIDVEVVSSAPSNALMIAETMRQNQIKQKEKKQPQLSLPPAKTPLALPPARQLALPPAKEEPPKPTDIEPEEDWEGEVEDNRKNPFVDKGIDVLRKEIDRDPNIPFSDDKIPYEDDITQIMKDRDKSMEEDEKEEGNNATPLPTADGKKQRRKTRGKSKVGLGRKMPGKSAGGLKGGLSEIAENVSDARQALFDFYKVQKDRFKLRKKLDKQLTTKLDAQKDERRLEGDPVKPDPDTGKLGESKELEQSGFEKNLLQSMASSLAVLFLPLLIKGMRPLFDDQADDLAKQEPEEIDTKEQEQLANDVETDTDELKKQDEKVEQGQETETETTNETENTEETTITNVESSETQDTNLESNTTTVESNVSNESSSETEEVPAFAEGGKITPAQAPSQGTKQSGDMQSPKADTNKRQGLQQLRKGDLSGKGAKALSKFVAPVKSVFKLPNIIAKKTLNLGKTILNPVSKIAGTAFKMTPMGMGMSILKSMKGDKGEDGNMAWEKYKESTEYKEVESSMKEVEKKSIESNTSTSSDTTQLTPPPTAEETRKDKLRKVAQSFSSNIMSDIKDRGVTGIMGGIADHFTGNAFDFDNKNLKPEPRNAMIEKGQSTSSKMVAALQSVKSRQIKQQMTKVNSGTGKKSQINSAPSSKSSKSSRNTSLQPGL